jgi:hypothetical protein
MLSRRKKVTVIFCRVLPKFPVGGARLLFEGSQVPPFCPSDNSSTNVKMGMERCGMTLEKEAEVLAVKPVPVALCLLQTSHEINRD